MQQTEASRIGRFTSSKLLGNRQECQNIQEAIRVIENIQGTRTAALQEIHTTPKKAELFASETLF